MNRFPLQRTAKWQRESIPRVFSLHSIWIGNRGGRGFHSGSKSLTSVPGHGLINTFRFTRLEVDAVQDGCLRNLMAQPLGENNRLPSLQFNALT